MNLEDVRVGMWIADEVRVEAGSNSFWTVRVGVVVERPDFVPDNQATGLIDWRVATDMPELVPAEPSPYTPRAWRRCVEWYDPSDPESVDRWLSRD